MSLSNLLSQTEWELLPVPWNDPEGSYTAIRLNSLGSLYFFAKYTLQRQRLVEHLHKPIALSLSKRHLMFLLELPRDHFKTTLVTEALPMWWALPFDEKDEAQMRALGYDDGWIEWMKYIHNPQIRILIISEVDTNAAMLGARIDQHFNSNSIFRSTFPEILPDTSCTWNASSKHVKHTGFHAHGEGTFDYLGVGGALQSRHYDRMIEDDLVGKAALKSEIVMNDTIDYHKLLEGAFDGPDHTEIVVGNRWSPWDLDGWIRENEPDFTIESHSALGGCCEAHPPGSPIFPEEFTVERLERIRHRQGPYLFSHQYLNQAIMPEEVVFKPEWIKFYAPTEPGETRVPLRLMPDPNPTNSKGVRADWLTRSMIVDPNHAGEFGRARHSIVIVALDQETDNRYLLDVWAQSLSLEDLMINIWKMAEKWKMDEFWLETIAAQKYLKYYIEYRNKIEKRTLRVRELKSERSKNAKWTRIDSLAPSFEQGKFFVRRDQSAFLDEYYRYSHSTKHTVDILDCLGYAPQTWSTVKVKELLALKRERRDKLSLRRGVTGY